MGEYFRMFIFFDLYRVAIIGFLAFVFLKTTGG